MKIHQHTQSGEATTWQWPVDVTHYDRTPQINPTEWQWLEQYCQQKLTIRSFKACVSFRRLLLPIEDALNITQPTKQTRSFIIRMILHEMYRKRLSFWGWTIEDWTSFLGKTQADFYQHLPPNAPRDIRHHLLIFSYLLCNWPDLHMFGTYRQYAIAMKVFGTDRINHSIQQVREVLLSWGYSHSRIEHRLPIAVAEVCLANRSPYLEDLTLKVLSEVREKTSSSSLQKDFFALSRALVSIGILPHALVPMTRGSYNKEALQDQGLDDISQEWVEHASYNVAKKVVEFEYQEEIPRRLLRAAYGDGFKGAPLRCSLSGEGAIPQDAGTRDGTATQDLSLLTPEEQGTGGTCHV